MQDYHIPLLSLMEASVSRAQDQMGSKLWGELPFRHFPSDNPQRRCEELYDIVLTNQRRAYDMYRVIAAIVDHGEYFALKLLITGLEVAMLRRKPGFRHVVYP